MRAVYLGLLVMVRTASVKIVPWARVSMKHCSKQAELRGCSGRRMSCEISYEISVSDHFDDLIRFPIMFPFNLYGLMLLDRGIVCYCACCRSCFDLRRRSNSPPVRLRTNCSRFNNRAVNCLLPFSLPNSRILPPLLG